MDLSDLGTVAAELMERLERDYQDDSEAELGTVAVVAEVSGEDWSAIEFRCTDGRRWVQAGLFHAAIRSAHASTEEK